MRNDLRILVVSEAVADAELVASLLREEFGQVLLSTNPERAVEEFEQRKPEVLVLAFSEFEKAERYYLGLYRRSTVIQELPHRTLILCNRHDLQRVYELCRKEYFDDYVLFWPIGHDTTRLRMAVHQLGRRVGPSVAAYPTSAEIVEQANNVARLEEKLKRSMATGDERIEAAHEGLLQARRGIDAAMDDFSRAISQGSHPKLVEVKDPDGLQQVVEQLKSDGIGPQFDHAANAVQPIRQWLGGLSQELAPHLESARALRTLVEQVRKLALVVDDDEFQHRLLHHVLSPLPLDLLFAVTVTEAMALLYKRRPALILMDIDLPDLSGIEATRQIKQIEQFREIPIVMITSTTSKSVVVESLRAGADGYIAKPFERDGLLCKMRGFLGLQAPEA